MEESSIKQLADLIVEYVEAGAQDTELRRSILGHFATKERASAFLQFIDWNDPKDIKERLPA